MKIKNIIGFAVITILILLIPLIAMTFTDEVSWTLFDFMFAGTLLFGSGVAYEFVSSKGSTTTYRAGVGIAVLASLLLVWVNGAVGIIGSEDNPANALYLIVPMVGIVGAALAKLETRGMSQALIATAIAQALVPVIAFLLFRADFAPGVVQILTLNAFFVMMFAVSAILFRNSATK